MPRLQAANLNDQVWSYLRRTLADPAWLLEYLPKELTTHTDFDASLVIDRLMKLEGITNLLFPVNQKALVLRLIDKVTIHPDRLVIELNLDELMELILELLVDQPDLATSYRQVYASARSHGR